MSRSICFCSVGSGAHEDKRNGVNRPKAETMSDRIRVVFIAPTIMPERHDRGQGVKDESDVTLVDEYS